MRRAVRTYLVIASLAVFLSMGGTLQSEPLRVAENLRKELVLIPAVAPDRNQLKQVSFVAIESEATVISFLASYDDPNTVQALDYVELYDPSGGLLLIGWVDNYGVRRLAIDSGLLREPALTLDRVLVLIAEGTSL